MTQEVADMTLQKRRTGLSFGDWCFHCELRCLLVIGVHCELSCLMVIGVHCELSCLMVIGVHCEQGCLLVFTVNWVVSW